MRTLTHQSDRFIASAPEDAFAAWVESERLCAWLTESCELEPRVGGRYRLVGRYTPGGGTADLEGGRVLRLEPPRLLEFSWAFAGAASTVTVTFAPGRRGEAAGTELALRQAFGAAPAGPGFAALVDDWWRMSLANLEAYLTGGELLRVDLMARDPRVHLSIHIAAPPARVWAALTDPKLLNRWIAAAARVEARPGGAYRYGWSYPVGDRQVEGGPTRILELVPNERLVTDWPDWRGEASKPVTRVVWQLAAVRGGTRLTLTHEGFAVPVDLSDYPYGWRAFLAALKSLAEGGDTTRPKSDPDAAGASPAL